MANHIIQTEDKLMKLIGMQVFDLDSLVEFSNTHQKNNEFTQYITIDPSGKVCKPKDLYNGILSGAAEIQRWDEDTREYSQRGISSYPVFNDDMPQSEWVGIANDLYLREKYRHKEDTENYFEGYDFSLADCENLVNDVKDSASGCVVWHPELYYVIAGVYTTKFNPRMSMVLVDSIKDSQSKEIASYIPFIADVPSTKGGFKYGARETEKREIKDGVASYRPPREGGRDNPDNLRAGELDISYNETTGKYEAGTKQVLVRLTTDILGVNSPGFDPETVHTIGHSQVYAKDAEFNQVGDWSKQANIGSGIPLHVQKSNPYLFGPNFINRFDSSNPNKKEAIRITNRTPRNFVANQLVLCSELDGEWIPQDLGEDTGLAAQLSIQRWQFQKLIASSDHFFRDKRYLTGGSEHQERVDPETYQSMTRNRFYYNLRNYELGGTNVVAGTEDISHLTELDEVMLNVVGYMNLGNSDSVVTENQKPDNWDFLPSNKYIQVTAFDQMGNFAGGKNKANVIARTNFSAPLDTSVDDSQPLPPYEMMEYWGATFPGGYNSEDVSRLLGERTDVIMRSTPLFSDYNYCNPFFFQDEENQFIGSDDNPAIVDNLPNRNVSISYAGKGMFNNTRDSIALNLPAEVATNGPPGLDKSSPLESLQFVDRISSETSNLVDSFYGVFTKSPITGEQNRFNWLHKYDDSDPNSGIMNPVYGLRPNNPNSIHFYPLAAEVVSSTDYNRGGTSPEGNVALEFGMLPLMAKSTEMRTAPWHSSQKENGVDHLLGSDSLFERNGESKRDFIQYSYNGFPSPPDSGKQNYIIPYFGYVERPATGKNDISLPDIWPDENNENASCVGVIASKCRISFRGTELKFSIDQQFGLALDSRATLAQSPSFSFLNLGGGIGVPLVGGSSFSNSNSSPRWGGISDEPNRFNTTALHVKMYDEWPEDQTVYDARYFSVFHFNPGTLLSKPDKSDTQVTIDGLDPFYPDVLSESVDFRVPTYLGNEPAKIGDIISGETKFADVEHWRVNTVRRGMMLTNGGFSYYRAACGLRSYFIFDGGTGYIDGESLEISGGSGSGASVKAIVEDGSIVGLNIVDPGEGYVPSDFGTLNEPETSKIVITGGSGSGSNIRITKGKIHRIEEKDEGPQIRSNSHERLTSSNSNGQGNKGTGFVEGKTEQFLTVQGKNNTGNYDLFFYFHNDVTHTVHYGGGNMLINPQRISMEISAV